MAQRYVAKAANRYSHRVHYLARANPYRCDTKDLQHAKTFTSADAAIAAYRAAHASHIDRGTIEAVPVRRTREGWAEC